MEPGESDPLVPELREAEAALETTLEEACATPPVTEVDTGELIHMDELLEVASDAAKRAISLRRRRRADKTQRAERAALADVEAEVDTEETHRVFTDARGVRWDVFAVEPEALGSEHPPLPGPYAQGWLCFQAGSEKRRLSPIPEGWQGMSNEQLSQLSQGAEVAARRGGRSRRRQGPEEPRRPE